MKETNKDITHLLSISELEQYKDTYNRLIELRAAKGELETEIKELETQISELLGSPESATVYVDGIKNEFRTPKVYTLDKGADPEVVERLTKGDEPILKIDYKVDARKYLAALDSSLVDDTIKSALMNNITVKPGKTRLTIREPKE